MTNCDDLDLSEEIKEKINKLAIISECYFDDSKNIFYWLKSNQYHPIGCEVCFSDDVDQDELGNITLGGHSLINFRDYMIDNNIILNDPDTKEVAIHVWVCPKCKKYIFDYLPQYDILPIRSEECPHIS
jgi:hypothetical protein